MVDLANIQSLDCQNIGDGLGVYANNTGGINEVLGFKTLIGGPGIVLNADDSTIMIEYVGMANGGAIPFSKIVGAPASITSLGLLYGTPDNRLDFITAPTRSNLVLTFNGVGFQWSDVPPGTVTSIAVEAGTGISVDGDPITSSGAVKVGLAPSGVIAGDYTCPTITLDDFGRVVSAVSAPRGDIDDGLSIGTGANVYLGKSNDTLVFRSIVGTGNVSITETGDTLIVASTGVTSIDIQGDGAINAIGGPITGTGVITLSLRASGVQAGTYVAPTLMIDESGRVTAAMSNGVGEINAARSLGSGTPIFTQKQGTEFQFRSIKTQGSISLSTTDEEITLNADAGVTRVELLAGPGLQIVGQSVITSTGSITLGLPETGVQAGTYSRPTVSVDTFGRISSIVENDPEPKLFVEAGDGLLVAHNGDAYSVGLVQTIATPGTYVAPTVSVDVFGRVTAIAETVMPASVMALIGDVIASGPSGSPVEAVLAPTGVVAGTYQNPRLTVDLKGRVTAIEEVPAAQVQASPLTPTGVAPGTYSNPSITIDQDGRVTSASSSASSLLPAGGNLGDVLTKVNGVPAWAAHPVKVIPEDLPPCQSWRLSISAIDGDNLLALNKIVFRSTVGGPAIILPGAVLCDDPGWGTNTPDKAFQSGTFVSTASINQGGTATIGFTFDQSVVVRDLSISAGVTGYSGPTKIAVQCLIGSEWATAWTIDTRTPWAIGETRAFPSTGGPADEAFRTLADTPNSYIGEALSMVRVRHDESGLEFVKTPRRAGTSQERPDYHDKDAGIQYFDTSLGKPIWWTGSTWVNAMGDFV